MRSEEGWVFRYLVTSNPDNPNPGGTGCWNFLSLAGSPVELVKVQQSPPGSNMFLIELSAVEASRFGD